MRERWSSITGLVSKANSTPVLRSIKFTADLLTAIEFDQDGEYLATGDRGGRVVIFEKGDDIRQVRAMEWCMMVGVWVGVGGGGGG
jgi:hypothetical protein